MALAPLVVTDVAPADITKALQSLIPKVRVERAQWIIAQLADRVERKRISEVYASVGKRFDAIESAAIAVATPAHGATLLAINGMGDAVDQHGVESEESAVQAVWTHFLARLAAARVTYLQASSETESDRRRLTRLGFRHLADLAFMVLERENFMPLPPSEVLTPSTVNHEIQMVVVGDDLGRLEAASQIAEQTFSGTHDCPLLGEFRSASEIVAGYRLSPQFDPWQWRILIVQGEPAGCLFLTRHRLEGSGSDEGQSATPTAVELAYMGVIPKFRGSGLGRVLLDCAINVSSELGASRMILAVDRRNSPAFTIYRQRGWVETAGESAWGMEITP